MCCKLRPSCALQGTKTPRNERRSAAAADTSRARPRRPPIHLPCRKQGAGWLQRVGEVRQVLHPLPLPLLPLRLPLLQLQLGMLVTTAGGQGAPSHVRWHC